MTQKRKAELQRKLSMAPVAKPPSDLIDRIESDIPQYLDAAHDRRRLASSVAFSIRVAASIILLVTSVFLTMQLVSRDGEDFMTQSKSVDANRPPAQPVPAVTAPVDVQQAADASAPAPAPARVAPPVTQ